MKQSIVACILIISSALNAYADNYTWTSDVVHPAFGQIQSITMDINTEDTFFSAFGVVNYGDVTQAISGTGYVLSTGQVVFHLVGISDGYAVVSDDMYTKNGTVNIVHNGIIIAQGRATCTNP